MTRSGKERKSAGNAHVCEKKKNVGEREKETGKEKSGEGKEKRKKDIGTGRNIDQGVHGHIIVVQVVVEVVQEVAGIRIITEEMRGVVRKEESE
jgi:ribosomal protein S25